LTGDSEHNGILIVQRRKVTINDEIAGITDGLNQVIQDHLGNVSTKFLDSANNWHENLLKDLLISL